MTTVTTRNTVTLNEAAALIMANPKNRVMLVGEPGIGKSAVIKQLQRETGYGSAYIDVPNLDLGDVAMPVIDHETRTTRYYPNSRFKLHEGKPVIIMLDEFTKGMDPVKNMLHPLLEVNNPRLGDVGLPEGSLCFLTGNLDSDGVGDSMLAHTKMRLTIVEVSKPTAEEWLLWAADNGIHPIIMAWVDRNPHALASYRDGDQTGNAYIFDPSKVQGAVVTPRTLELASNLIWARDKVTHNTLIAALEGTVGEAASESIAAFIRHQDSLPSWDSIMRDPHGCAVPDEGNAGALAVLVFGAIERVASKEEVSQFIKYFSRVDEEWQSMFCLGLAKNTKKQGMAFSCAAFADWVAKNEDLL